MEEDFISACGMAEDALDGLVPNLGGEGTAACADDELVVGPEPKIDLGTETSPNDMVEDGTGRFNSDSNLMDSGAELQRNSGDVLADTLDQSGDVPNTENTCKNNDVSFKGSTHHFYCPKCGHTWYAPGWPSYCPKWGCTGTPTEM